MSEKIPLLAVCPSCKKTILPTDNFCPSCGFNLRPVAISIARQVYIYLVSIFLPPFGLLYTWRYRSGTSQEKRIGIIAAVLTIISFILTIWWTIGFVDSIQKQVSSYSNLGL